MCPTQLGRFPQQKNFSPEHYWNLRAAAKCSLQAKGGDSDSLALIEEDCIKLGVEEQEEGGAGAKEWTAKTAARMLRR